MIENYADKNIDETIAAIDGFDSSGLQQFLVHEREHKNRKGVIEHIQDQLVTVKVPSTGYYGGHWFDDAGEYVVIDSRRLREAASETKLEILDQ